MKRLQIYVYFLFLFMVLSAQARPTTDLSPANTDNRVYLIALCGVILLFVAYIGLTVYKRKQYNEKLRNLQEEDQSLCKGLSDKLKKEELKYKQLHYKYDEAVRLVESLQEKLTQIEEKSRTQAQQLTEVTKNWQAALHELEELRVLDVKCKPFLSFNPENPESAHENGNPEAVKNPETNIDFGLDNDMDDSNKAFVAKITAFIKENIDNSELNIEEFAKRQNISRSSLYRQIKAATGLTPIEFIHKARINYSIELMKSDYTFSQIAYMTGFNDPKYFSKCFKKYMGMTPTEYKERKF